MILKITNKFIIFTLISIFLLFLSSCGNDRSVKLSDEDLKCEIKNPEYKFLEETPCICNKKCALKAFNDLIIGEDGYIAKWEGTEPVEIRIIGKNMKQDFNEVKKLIEKPVDLINSVTPFDLKIVYDPDSDKKLYRRTILIFYVDDIEDAIRNDFPILDKMEREKILDVYLKEMEMPYKEKNKSYLVRLGDYSDPFFLNFLFINKKIRDSQYIANSIFKLSGIEATLDKQERKFYDNKKILLLLFHNLILLYNNEEITSGKKYKDIKSLFKEIYKNEDPIVAYVGKNKEVYEKLMSRIRFILKTD
jgi:hypothetical protein